MNLKYYFDLIMGKTDAQKPAKLTWTNIKAFFQALFRKRKKQQEGLDIHIYEQIIWRRTQVMSLSPKCWDQGHCRICGCEILGKTMEDRGCAINEIPLEDRDSNPCYPDMMDEKVWESYKKSKNIKLFE